MNLFHFIQLLMRHKLTNYQKKSFNSVNKSSQLATKINNNP